MSSGEPAKSLHECLRVPPCVEPISAICVHIKKHCPVIYESTRARESGDRLRLPTVVGALLQFAGRTSSHGSPSSDHVNEPLTVRVQALQLLRTAIETMSPHVFVGDIGTEREAQLLIVMLTNLLSDDDPMIRDEVTGALESLIGTTCTDGIVKILIEKGVTSNDQPVAISVVEMLGKAGPGFVSRTVPALQRLLTQSPPELRQAACEALGDLGADSVDAVQDLLGVATTHDVEDVCRAAIAALLRIRCELADTQVEGIDRVAEDLVLALTKAELPKFFRLLERGDEPFWELKRAMKKRLSSDGHATETQDKRIKGDTAKLGPKRWSAPLRAYAAFLVAEVVAEEKLTVSKAYEYLKESGVPDATDGLSELIGEGLPRLSELADYKPPSLETFTRHVGTARHSRGEQRNVPRAGRATGKSVAGTKFDG